MRNSNSKMLVEIFNKVKTEILHKSINLYIKSARIVFSYLISVYLSSVLPACVVVRVLPVYLHSSNVVVPLLGLVLLSFDMKDSQKNQDGQESAAGVRSRPDAEPHVWDKSSRQVGPGSSASQEVVMGLGGRL